MCIEIDEPFSDKIPKNPDSIKGFYVLLWCILHCFRVWHLLAQNHINISRNSLIPTLGGCERLFFFGSREKNALAVGRQLESHVSMTFMQRMNKKWEDSISNKQSMC